MLLEGLLHTNKITYTNQYALLLFDINQYGMQESYMLYTS